MRAVIAYLLAPLAGLLVFVGVWASPLVAYARPDADFLGLIWAMVGGIVVPAFAVVLALSLGVMFLVRARFRGAWWASAGGGMALYLAAFALLALEVGFARVFANPYWLTGLLLGGLVHGLAFRALVGPGRPARGT